MGGFMISRHENKIQEIKTFIETKYRGKCLSTDNDIINDSKILFECENKHQFKKSIRSIYDNGWCRECMKEQLFFEMKKVATEKNCICLDEAYISYKSNYNWECLLCGNIWKRSFNNFKNSVCPQCIKLKKEKEIIKKLNECVIKRQGTYVLDEFKSGESIVEVTCHNKHTWKMSIGNLLWRESWCIECLRDKKLEIARQIAKDREGKCLSTEYIGCFNDLV
jgi:hypothetical protein